jgi:hypothetical protein
MRFLIPFSVAMLLVLSCFLPWMTVESRNITITGVDTTGTNYAKPAYFHFFWVGLYLLVMLIDKVWSRRVAMVFAAFNFAWAARNFLLIPACQMGDCPVRKIGLYLLLLSSLALIFAGLLAPSKTAPQAATTDGSNRVTG